MPIANRTLHRYKREHLADKVRRPLEAYQRRLEEEHVLIDTVRERAALILAQQARVQKALDLKARPAGGLAHGAPGIVTEAAGREIDRLTRLYDGYDEAVYKLGLVRRANGDFSPVGRRSRRRRRRSTLSRS